MPSDFPCLPLGEITVNFDKLRVPVRKNDRTPGPYPYYGASGIADYVDDYIFDGEYLLIAEDGENLRTRNTPVAFMASGKFWVNNHAHIVQGNERAATRYLSYVLQTLDLAPYLSGSTRPKLTQRDLNRIEVPCPDPGEQLRIAAVLGALDDKIELNRKINRTLEEMAQAIFKSWFIDFDGVPESEMVESELGLIPKGWEVAALPAMTSYLRRGLSPKYVAEGGVRVLNQKCIRDFRVQLDQARRHDPAKRNIDGRLLEPGDVLVNSTGVGTLGRVAQLDMYDEPLTCDSHVTVVRAAEGLSKTFFGAYLMHLQPRFEELGHGSTGQTELRKKDFDLIRLVVPSSGLQRRFEQAVAPARTKMFASERESDTLAELRDTLLPKLISGEIRVPEAEKAVEAIA